MPGYIRPEKRRREVAWRQGEPCTEMYAASRFIELFSLRNVVTAPRFRQWVMTPGAFLGKELTRNPPVYLNEVQNPSLPP